MVGGGDASEIAGGLAGGLATRPNLDVDVDFSSAADWRLLTSAKPWLAAAGCHGWRLLPKATPSPSLPLRIPWERQGRGVAMIQAVPSPSSARVVRLRRVTCVADVLLVQCRRGHVPRLLLRLALCCPPSIFAPTSLASAFSSPPSTPPLPSASPLTSPLKSVRRCI